jgi:hypothetical protein
MFLHKAKGIQKMIHSLSGSMVDLDAHQCLDSCRNMDHIKWKMRIPSSKRMTGHGIKKLTCFTLRAQQESVTLIVILNVIANLEMRAHLWIIWRPCSNFSKNSLSTLKMTCISPESPMLESMYPTLHGEYTNIICGLTSHLVLNNICKKQDFLGQHLRIYTRPDSLLSRSRTQSH